jgi:hypothetical protein
VSNPDPAASTTTIDLLLDGTVAKTPITLRGTVEDGGLAGLTGRADVRQSLKSILEDLGADFKDAGGALGQLLGSALSDITLDSLAVGYRTADPALAQVVVSMRAGASAFRFVVLKMTGAGGGFIAGLELQLDNALFTNNPLTGLTGEIAVGELAFYYASRPLRKVRYYPAHALQDARATLPDIGADGREGRDFTSGLNWSPPEIRVGGINLFEGLEVLDAGAQPPADTTPAPPPAADTPAAPAPKGSIFWINTDKEIGPVTIRRVGLSYDTPEVGAARVGVRLDAGLQLACLTFNLDGLGVSYPLDQLKPDFAVIRKHIRFHLDGASVAFDRDPITISGGLFLASTDPLKLTGTLLIRTKAFTISALGAYEDMNGTPSFFVFAALVRELGGPAFFFVTGLAVGFGVHRALKLPSINDVHLFPLIRAATDETYLGPKMDLRMVSEKLDEYIYAQKGNFWIAAGVRFTSFGQIESFAMLSVSFGTHLEIALLGLSKIRVPKVLPDGPEVPVLVYAEMAFKIAFSPEHGLLSFEARLTENSYVLTKDFRLRGGFAFYSWFAGDHAGDFVVSIGGYHPRFVPPAHYPRPDLVEFKAKIGDAITIQGFCYFALCPSAIMAGGGLSLVYQAGGVKAWFIVYAHFLIQWKPLAYDIAIGISIGVALNLDIGITRINLSLELSASVALYGPPLGGRAEISLSVISFTVTFGEGKSLPPPLDWSADADPDTSFAKAFLPNPHVTTIAVAEGLLEEITRGKDTIYFVNPQKLVLTTLTVVPATEATYNGTAQTIPQPTIGGRPTGLGVRPMRKSSFHSSLAVTLRPQGGSGAAQKYLDQFIAISPTRKSVPIALWGADPLNTVNPPKEQMIDNAMAGFELKPKEGPRPSETPALSLEVLKYDRATRPFAWSMLAAKTELGAFGARTIANTINAPDVIAKRTAILTLLAATGRRIVTPEEVRLDQLQEKADYIFQAMPVMAHVGQYPPRGWLETGG